MACHLKKKKKKCSNEIEVRDSELIVKCIVDVQVNVHNVNVSCPFMDLAI